MFSLTGVEMTESPNSLGFAMREGGGRRGRAMWHPCDMDVG